jgi:hypothetical protein
MKQSTRDNLIYLAVGLSIAALLAADAFYSESHDRKMWMPSRFAFNAVTFMGVLAYMVAREARRATATVAQTVSYTLLACLLHWVVALAFPQIFAKPFYSGLWVFIVLELFLITLLMARAALYLRSRP